MAESRFSQLIGCRVPIQQAGMGGVAGPELAVAVSEAGGLGTVALPMVPAPAVAATLDDMRRATSAPFAFNVLMPFLDREAVAAAASRCRLVELFYADPDAELVRLVHDGGALAGWQVGSRDEALAARDAGCDVVIVQGTEAGGHVRATGALAALLDEVLPELDIPVVAAGGIGSVEDVARAFEAGADAVRVGTRFVATHEADAHPGYAAALVQARAGDTVLTETFSVLWPHAPHRVLRSCIAEVEGFGDAVVGELDVGDATVPIPARSVLCPTRATRGTVGAMALYAGTSVTNVTDVVPAATVVDELAAGVPTELLDGPEDPAQSW